MGHSQPQRHLGWRWLALLAAAAALLAMAYAARPLTSQLPSASGHETAVAPQPQAGLNAPPLERPNIVFVLTDDLSWDLVRYMPQVRQLARDGSRFSRYFVTSSLCCPSRATILSGQYPHNAGVVRNNPPRGGYQAWQADAQQRSLGAVLQQAGYRTALLGKFLNNYHPHKSPPDPGWDYWWASGYGYQGYNYSMREYDAQQPLGSQTDPNGLPGRVVRYGDQPQDYLVDVMTRQAQRWISANSHQPFFIKLAPFTPHLPAVPAYRHRHRYLRLKLPRDGAFNRRVSHAPRWLAYNRRLSPAKIARARREYRKRVRSVLAIDEMIGQLRQTLAQQGLSERTYIVFSSDNGYHLGQHRLRSGKRTAFEHDIRVPLIVAGPGVAAKQRISSLAASVDLMPSFARMAQASSPPWSDGRSLLGLMRGRQPRQWRKLVLLQHAQPTQALSGDPDGIGWNDRTPGRYHGFRAPFGTYVENSSGEREYYHRAGDPYQLRNRYSQLAPADARRFHRALRQLRRCAGLSCRDADRPVLGAPRLSGPARP